VLFWRYFGHDTCDREYSRNSRSRTLAVLAIANTVQSRANKFKMAVKQNLLPPGTDLSRTCSWMTVEKLRLSRYSCLGGTTGTTFITLSYSKQYSTNQASSFARTSFDDFPANGTITKSEQCCSLKLISGSISDNSFKLVCGKWVEVADRASKTGVDVKFSLTRE
jgi:hypothetical protein